MEIRGSLNQNKKIGIGIGAAILLLAIALIAFQLSGNGNGISGSISAAYYTDDNGKTFFQDDAFKVSPFDHNGKQAYRCDVFEGSDGKRFVGLIYRHNANGRKRMEEHVASGKRDENFLRGIALEGNEVKPAGAPDTAWTINNDPVNRMLSVKDPSGQRPPKLVTP